MRKTGLGMLFILALLFFLPNGVASAQSCCAVDINAVRLMFDVRESGMLGQESSLWLGLRLYMRGWPHQRRMRLRLGLG